MEDIKLTFLTIDQIWGNNQLEIFKKYGTKASLSDFSIILGAYVSREHTSEGNDLKDRTGWYWTKTSDGSGDARVVYSTGNKNNILCRSRDGAVRAALSFSSNLLIPTNAVRGRNGLDEIEYGEYPQTIADKNTAQLLNLNFNLGSLTETGKEYTVDSRKYDEYDKDFSSIKLKEYEYNGQKYVRVKVNSHTNGDSVLLSDAQSYKNDDYVWVKVEPIKWFREPNKNLFVSKKCLYAGVRFDKETGKYDDINFDQTEINKFMQTFFIEDIIPSKVPKIIKNEKATINNFIFVDKDGNKRKKRIVVKVKNKN